MCHRGGRTAGSMAREMVCWRADPGAALLRTLRTPGLDPTPPPAPAEYQPSISTSAVLATAAVSPVNPMVVHNLSALVVHFPNALDTLFQLHQVYLSD